MDASNQVQKIISMVREQRALIEQIPRKALEPTDATMRLAKAIEEQNRLAKSERQRARVERSMSMFRAKSAQFNRTPLHGPDLPPLSPAAAVAYEILMELPTHRALKGPDLLTAMSKKGENVDQSTLTTTIVPALKPYGIENVHKIGYRITPSRRKS